MKDISDRVIVPDNQFVFDDIEGNLGSLIFELNEPV